MFFIITVIIFLLSYQPPFPPVPVYPLRQDETQADGLRA